MQWAVPAFLSLPVQRLPPAPLCPGAAGASEDTRPSPKSSVLGAGLSGCLTAALLHRCATYARIRARTGRIALAAAGAAGAAGSSPSVTELIRGAIARGAPTYNSGDVAGCAQIYTAAAQLLVQRPELEQAARATLQDALQTCAASSDMSANAWTLRRALDAVAAGASGAGTAGAAPARPAGGGKEGPAVLCDFVRGTGLGFRARCVNDTVMGGRSESSLTVTERGLLFEGNVTRNGGGGFCSIRLDAAEPGELVRAGRFQWPLFRRPPGAGLQGLEAAAPRGLRRPAVAGGLRRSRGLGASDAAAGLLRADAARSPAGAPRAGGGGPAEGLLARLHGLLPLRRRRTLRGL